jgi:hypothetical protein
MKLPEATSLIMESTAQMNMIDQHVVFDELAIVHAIDEKLYLCWYRGTRGQEYILNFKKDTALLKKESLSRFSNHYETGAYEFVVDATGSQAESFLVIGENLYLILTNTQRTMAEIASSPLWLKAQTVFVEMCERFRCDPAIVSEDDFKEEIPLG